jgi:hypothetical protein
MPEIITERDEIRQSPISAQDLQKRTQELIWQRRQEIIAIVPAELKSTQEGAFKVTKYLILHRNQRG